MKPGDSVSIGAVLIEIEASEEAETHSSPEPSTPSETPPPTEESQAATEPAAVSQAGPVEFVLPGVGEGIDKVDIAAVMVKAGDVIGEDAVICEVETDKAVAEINYQGAGTVTAVHIAAGQTVSVGTPLITVQPDGSSTKSSTTAAPPSTASASSSAATPVSKPAAAPEKSNTAATSGSTGGNRPPAPAGPATRRLARKLGVDLYQVNGSAAGGRITIEDVEAFVRDRLSRPVPSAAGTPGVGVVAAAPLPDFSKFGPVEKLPLNKIFRTAAANLHAAWVTIPHVTQHDLADITELETARKRYVKANPTSPKITMTAIMIKAVVGALKAFPHVNSSVDLESGELIIKNYYHIGVAVDTPNGLVVPVIRNCDQKNVLQVAAELTEIAGKARDRKLKAEDMQGGTFTITNLGGIGGTHFTPIVNYPEVAILGMSRGQKQLFLEDGQVTERLMLPLSLSYDHRAINGADAARFIVKLSSSLSNFFELF
ncbi:MAG: 2-oxo acid dehydrogenase subunit E2 [Planctomycetaceae bacterium]|nr:2-oxo acid dehydrogenase subunit E2 [Planctomycetaceae bacterium]